MLDKKGQQKYRKILFKRIQEIGNRDLLEIFFSNLNKLFSDNNITEEDIKAFCTVRKDETSLKFTYGQRYVHNIRRDGDQYFFAYIINDSDSAKYDDSDNVAKSDFSGSLPMKYIDVALDEHLSWPYENRSLISDCSIALGLEKDRGKDFSFQKTFKESHNPLIYDMAMNEKLRNNVFDQILGVKAADGSVKVVEEHEIVFNDIESRNIILYGPPGTGKTYKTIDLSVKIIDGKDNGHVSNKKRFDEFLRDGQIQFVTFHQNYSYEDFVVGLRPVENAGSLIFKRHEGIFYEICKRAEKNYMDYMKGEGSLTFEEVFQKYFEEVLRGGAKEIVMASGVSFKVYDITDTTIRFEKNTGDRQHSLSISTLSDIYHGRRAIIGGLKYYYDPIVRDLSSISSNKDKVKLQNFVLIIDEINRANISKVFGELITLIEEDKRMGGANELRVTLPNGERNFSIPPNLYIIGTMNTADKSISQIDVALRRRFEFQAQNPKPELLSREQADFLNAVNKEILEYKRSTDFLIGHGYFMGKTGVLAEDIIEFRIKPLLNEYFPGRADIVDSILRKALRNDPDVGI
jgi:5-methylcytosine-specific restriction protein B